VKPATTITLETFLDLLRSGNLLTAEQLARVEQHSAQAEHGEPGPLAWWLVEQNLVTRWQARMLMSGRKTFFFGKYKLLDLLGAGGMGSVYTAWQPGLSRVVALKVMADKLLENEQAVARFHREIQSAAALEHPNIVSTFDADCFMGKHFLVMEYMAGENLDVLAKRRGRLPVSEACEYVRQAALGLAHAHDRKMVHRDIKPANLLIGFAAQGDRASAEGAAENAPSLPVVKILDFGLARLTTDAHGDTELTQTGQIMGTPDYIAPEQARDTKAADARSDIYSLGCTLFRLVTGQVPFVRQSVMEKLMARALDEAPRARSICPDLPGEVDECIARMLAREPEKRFQTAQEVATRLQSLAAKSVPALSLPGVGVSGSASRLVQPLDLLAPPDREMEQFLAVLADEAKGEGSDSALIDTTRAAVIGSGSGATLSDAREAKKPGAGRKPRRTTLNQPTTARKKTAPRVVVAALGALLAVAAAGFAVWYQSGATRLEIDWPENERKGATFELDGREPILGAKLAFSGRPGKRRVEMTRKGYEPIEKEFSMSRGEVISFRPEWVPLPQTVRRRDLAALKTEVDRAVPTGRGKARPAFDPKIAALRTRIDDFRSRWLMTPESVQAAGWLRRLPAPADTLGTSVGFEPELRLPGQPEQQPVPQGLVAAIGDGRFRHSGAIWTVAYSPDDSIVAAVDGSGWLKLWNPETGEELRSAKIHDTSIIGLAFSPDGKRLVTGSYDTFARVWETSSLRELRTLRGYPNQVRTVVWSPNGDQVAAAGIDPTIMLWNPDDGKVIRTIDKLPGTVASLAFSPDGSRLAAGYYDPYEASIIDVDSGEIRHRLTGHEHQVLAVEFSPDGKRLATSGYDATLKTWDVESGRPLLSIPRAPSSPVTSLRFRAGGRTIVLGLGGGVDGNLELRDAESGRLEKQLHCDEPGTWTLALAHRSSRAAVAGAGQTVHVCDLESGDEPVTPAPRMAQIAASPDGRWLALGSLDGTIDLWDIASRKVAFTLRGHKYGVWAMAVSPDGRRLASIEGSTAAVHMWDVTDGTALYVMDNLPAGSYSLAFSPDARNLAIGGTDGRTRLWNLETRGLLKVYDGQMAGAVSAVAFNSTGNLLAAGHFAGGALTSFKLFDVESGREKKTIEAPIGQALFLSFGADDKILASGHLSLGVKFWDLARGNERTYFTGTGPFAFSPTGDLLAAETGSEVHLYNVAHGDRAAQFSLGHGELSAVQLVFTPEGRHIAALGGDGNVYVFRVPAIE